MPVNYTNFPAPGAPHDSYKNQAMTGFKNVSTLLGKADSALIKANPASPDKAEETRFTTWFGPYTAPNIATVKAVIHTMVLQLQDTNSVTIQYDPVSHDFAYVMVPVGLAGTPPARVPAALIHLGSAYFTAPALGQDSQTGTIIHELSHLIGHTVDAVIPGGAVVAYGEAACKTLVAANPALAMTNADNYLFYCCSFGLS